MYAALWRTLPGPPWVRAVLCAALLLVVVAICFQWVFPAVSEHLPFTDNTVGAATLRHRAPLRA
ncbi:MAG: hypothetical protein WBL35_03525 [Ornithinibacter sp.]